LLKKIKFASTSAIATALDYALFFLCSYFGLMIQVAHFFSYAIASTFNFLLQKKYIFELNRKVHHAFIISISFSVISLLLSTGIIYLLSWIEWWSEYPIFPKLITTFAIFFFNFYTKKFAFEGIKKSPPNIL
jgi:putative flippase GtrA